tara:strand:+ start:1857 stop:2276 length:420 start_codon:yes stop_codon:yes gene_type:complete
MNWKCKHTWRRAINNTLWCLLGCSIGDFGTIFFFQSIEQPFSITFVMSLAILNGLITSIILETLILLKQMDFRSAINTAFGMSFISMIGMELSMNITDVVLTGGAMLTWWAVPIMLFVGFITPLPYNYYKLKKYNIGCH